VDQVHEHILSSLLRGPTFSTELPGDPPLVQDSHWRRSLEVTEPIGSSNIQTFSILFGAAKSRSLVSPMGAAHIVRIFKRRSAARYKLRLPVIFHWNEGTEHTSGGFTCDVALDGALILSRKCPPVGSEVRVEILLPSPEMENEEICISCTGKVVHSSARRGYSEFGFRGLFQDDQLTRHILDFESRR
jgi:hypothetical protein